MPVDPQCQFLLDQMAASDTKMTELDPPAARAVGDAGLTMVADLAPPVDLASVTDTTFPGPAGDVPIRVYRPHGDGPLPGVVFFHGGGFVVGSIATHDPICRLLAAEAGAVVVSVGYRLAPEDPFPAGVEDCIAATGWVADNAASLDIDASRLVVCGDSAGGNLAAVVAQHARAHGPALAFQALMYPAVDADRAHYPSVTENAEGYLLEAETMAWFQQHYVAAGAEVDPHDPRISPLRAGSLAGVAPAYVVTAQFDPLRDEGEAYASALEAAGVPVAMVRYDGMIHGFWNFIGLVDAAAAATVAMAAAIREAVA
jgi:acetyl esterase